MAHAVDVGLQLLVGVDGYVSHEVVVCLRCAEEMVSAILGIGCGVEQMLQHVVLQLLGLCEMAFQLMLSWYERSSYYTCQTHWCLVCSQ